MSEVSRTRQNSGGSAYGFASIETMLQPGDSCGNSGIAVSHFEAVQHKSNMLGEDAGEA
jgi:hypothetical protein